MNENPLVSVVVITYNSAKTVLETLDSIAAQTYKNIELIISDDCSKDETVKFCKDWLKENRERFVRTEIVTVEKNTGIVKNCNRGTRIAHGEWIKGIAGDDILKPQCLETFVKFALQTPDCKMCCCDLDVFTTSNRDLKKIRDYYDYCFNCVSEPQYKQWRKVKYDLTFPGPGYFYSKSLYDEIGGYDEDYVMLEETPFVFKVLERGYRIYPIKDRLILYRVSEESACRSSSNTTLSKTYLVLLNDKYLFFKKHQLPALLRSGMLFTAIKYSVKYIKTDIKIKYGRNLK